ncbi:MAG: OsmC family peroxiredoxin [Solirubrobacteraceae bacterium]
MPGVHQKAAVRWIGSVARGEGTLRASSGALDGLGVDLPNRRGEASGRTSPEELIAAAHATCFTMALGAILAGERTPPETLDVEATSTLEPVGEQRCLTRIELTVRGRVPGIDAAAFEAAVSRAERECVVSRALAGNVQIASTATLDPELAS